MLTSLYMTSLATCLNLTSEDSRQSKRGLSDFAAALNDARRRHRATSASGMRIPRNPWEDFYATHGERFFKDRHYLELEHDTLACALGDPLGVVRVLDFGCGVGNAIIPLLEKSAARVEYLGIDISSTAVDILKGKLRAFPGCVALVKQLDLVSCSDGEWEAIQAEFEAITGVRGDFDFCFMIFTVSAFSPKNMITSVLRPCQALKLGVGRLCFRDYLEGDLAQLRFANGQCLGRNFYIRQDGTYSFFFSEAGLSWLFKETEMMRLVWVKPIRRVVKNRSTDLKMYRAWIGAEFIKC